MGAVTVGEVREGKGGKRYAYVGGDEKSRDAWKEVKAEPEKPGLGSKVLAGLETANEGAKFLNKLNPLSLAASKVGEAVSPENAYDIGGKVTDFTGSPELGALSNAATMAIPSILAGGPAKAAAESILKPAGRRVMQSAISPDKASRMSGDAAKAVETMLKEGVNVSSGGLAKLSNEVKALSQQVDDIINAAEKSGTTVSKVNILKSWSAELKKISGPLDSADDVAQAKGVLNRVLNDSRLKDSDAIPIRLAQDLKTATYRSLGEKAYNQADNMTTAKIGSLKSVIRGLKEGIEESAPGVAAPNKRMSELLNAIEVVEPGALAAGNKTLGGLSYLAENPMAAGGFMLDRSPYIRSILGRALYSGAPSVLGNSAKGVTAFGLGAAQDY